MEFISTDEYFILQPLQKGESNVLVSRRTGKFEVRPSWDLASQDNPECLGLVWALVGKVRVHPELCERLLLVRRCDRICELPGGGGGGASEEERQHGVYKVQNVVTVPITTAPLTRAQLGLKPCPKHQPSVGK